MLLEFWMRWVLLSIMLAFYLIYFKGGKAVVKDIQQSADTKSFQWGRVLIVTIALLTIGIIGNCLAVALGKMPVLPTLEKVWVVALGVLLTTLSIIAMSYTRYQFLRKLWAANVVVQNTHEIIDTGPYALARHPIYTCALFYYLGVALAFGSLINLVLCMSIIFCYILLTAYEDVMLSINLAGYSEYKRKVKYKLIPKMW
jgi:protein-S-isoprenylcysteine O-methyltransferase Ste14